LAELIPESKEKGKMDRIGKIEYDLDWQAYVIRKPTDEPAEVVELAQKLQS
jgi:hypothetical protein